MSGHEDLEGSGNLTIFLEPHNDAADSRQRGGLR